MNEDELTRLYAACRELSELRLLGTDTKRPISITIPPEVATKIRWCLESRIHMETAKSRVFPAKVFGIDVKVEEQ